ncbi:hypothetical protein [Polaromonas sp. YR568]|uniref:hypothetical protein n=1 Tax=Polaromonas sp. YR568 TaxID=1855301 RepID=UPI00398BC736
MKAIVKRMPPSEKHTRHLPRVPEEKSKADKRLMENGLLVALCVAAAVAGYFVANFVSRWILEIG